MPAEIVFDAIDPLQTRPTFQHASSFESMISMCSVRAASSEPELSRGEIKKIVTSVSIAAINHSVVNGVEEVKTPNPFWTMETVMA